MCHVHTIIGPVPAPAASIAICQKTGTTAETSLLTLPDLGAPPRRPLYPNPSERSLQPHFLQLVAFVLHVHFWFPFDSFGLSVRLRARHWMGMDGGTGCTA